MRVSRQVEVGDLAGAQGAGEDADAVGVGVDQHGHVGDGGLVYVRVWRIDPRLYRKDTAAAVGAGHIGGHGVDGDEGRPALFLAPLALFGERGDSRESGDGEGGQEQAAVAWGRAWAEPLTAWFMTGECD